MKREAEEDWGRCWGGRLHSVPRKAAAGKRARKKIIVSEQNHRPASCLLPRQPQNLAGFLSPRRSAAKWAEVISTANIQLD